MPDSPAVEVRDLEKVHEFYVSLLEESVGSPVPVPRAIEDLEPNEYSDTAIAIFRRWLAILDLAISPPAVRDALKQSTRYETAESLLRYYFRKGAPSDREKADFVVTFLYRSKQNGGAAASPSFDPVHDADTATAGFEGEIYKILGEVRPPELPPEHIQLVKEFEYLYQEIEDFRHFDALMDSGIIQRARTIKQSIGSSFYHPRVLATMAVYNVTFGAKFDQLFRDAASQIKTFAARVQQEGGSIMSRVEGDVMVKHLAEVEESRLLTQEYGSALEDFRKVSHFKKAVDRKRAGRAGEGPPPPPSAVAAAAIHARHEAGEPPISKGAAVQPLVAVPQSQMVEEGKIRSMVELIRNFLRTADRSISVIPLRNASLTLSPAEGEAFRAEFLGEKSFRGDYAAHIMWMVGIFARFLTESVDYIAKKGSAYLWKPHADSLTYLLSSAERALQRAAEIAATCEQRGLAEKGKSLQATADKLRVEMKKVAKLLQT